MQGYYNISFFMFKGATALKHNTVIFKSSDSFLKDPRQALLFSMPTKLLMLHGEVKFCCFIVSCVPESMPFIQV